MNKRNLNRGDVVQIRPDSPHVMFAACFLTVTEGRAWGCIGYLQVLGSNGELGGRAFLRVKFEHIEYIGITEFMVEEDQDDN